MRRPLTVISSGSPGPAPTRWILAVVGRASWPAFFEAIILDRPSDRRPEGTPGDPPHCSGEMALPPSCVHRLQNPPGAPLQQLLAQFAADPRRLAGRSFALAPHQLGAILRGH